MGRGASRFIADDPPGATWPVDLQEEDTQPEPRCRDPGELPNHGGRAFAFSRSDELDRPAAAVRKHGVEALVEEDHLLFHVHRGEAGRAGHPVVTGARTLFGRQVPGVPPRASACACSSASRILLMAWAARLVWA